MTTDLKCPLICENTQCPVLSLLRDLLDAVKVGQPSWGKNRKKNVSPKHLPVNGFVVALQVEYPDKAWTSDSLAEEIGCTGAAVRKTRAWKDYQKRLRTEAQRRPPKKGFRSEWGNLDAYDTGDEDGLDDEF